MGRKFIILTDTGCDLDNEYLSNNNVEIVKLGYNIDNVDYEGNDGKHIDVKEFYSLLKNGAMPKTMYFFVITP